MHKVMICGIDTNKLPKIKNSESMELLQKIKDGDKESREFFILANLRLVLSVVQRFNNKNNSDDLFQIGTVGLIKALDNFDLKYNVKFSTYAVPMIIGEIRRYIKEQSGIRVARSIRDTAYKALQAREKLELTQQREPSIIEIAEAIDLPIREVACALDAVSEPISLFESAYNDGDDALLLMEQIHDDTVSNERTEELFMLNEGLTKLNIKEREILNLRYFIGKTQIEIATELNISQAQVSRLEKNAISHLRDYVV